MRACPEQDLRIESEGQIRGSLEAPLAKCGESRRWKGHRRFAFGHVDGRMGGWMVGGAHRTSR